MGNQRSFSFAASKRDNGIEEYQEIQEKQIQEPKNGTRKEKGQSGDYPTRD
jgi:hypothetical protein